MDGSTALAEAWRPVVLWTDVLVYLLVAGGGAWAVLASRREYWRVAAREVAGSRVAMVSLGIVLLYASVGLLDSVHYRGCTADGRPRGEVRSLLDAICAPLTASSEKTYSAPLAVRSFTKETVVRPDGTTARERPYLARAGSHLPAPREDRAAADIAWRILKGVLVALVMAGLYVGAVFGLRRLLRVPAERGAAFARSGLWVAGFLGVVTLLVSVTAFLAGAYHPLGTDKAGTDVLYIALKSVRTGLVIGTLTTLIVTPFAVLFGVLAGYLGGWVDAAITYVYATLGSIPWILLVIAGMMILNLGEAEEETFRTADKKLLYLCTVMGLTSWAGLCRLIRGEVLKLREVEYVQAAEALGAGRAGVMFRHLVPNVMHIVLISVVLRFSGLVLAEAVLAYIGIGVDPSMQSWGNMINAARLELAQDPVVWWQLAAAFVFMLGLVLPANLFGDAVRDALDPRLRTQ